MKERKISRFEPTCGKKSIYESFASVGAESLLLISICQSFEVVSAFDGQSQQRPLREYNCVNRA